MKKVLEVLFRYVITLSALSVMIFWRSRLGADNFLPWGMKPKFSLARIIARIFTVALLFTWVRFFFIAEYYYSASVAPFPPGMTIFELLIEYRPYIDLNVRLSVLQILYFLSLLTPFVAICQLAAIEVYYLRKIPITSYSLGKGFLLYKLEGTKIWRINIDNYVVWTIESCFLIAIGLILNSTIAPCTLSPFLTIAGTSMLFQAQILRLKIRDTIEKVVNSGGLHSAIQPATEQLSLNAANKKTASDNDQIAGIA